MTESDPFEQATRVLQEAEAVFITAGAGIGAVVEMGAGKAVPTVRYQSESVARREKATLIRINPRDHDVPDSRHISLPVGSKEGIARICGEFVNAP